MLSARLLLAVLAVLLLGGALQASAQAVALTVDDLPYAGADTVTPALSATAAATNRKLLRAFVRHHVPVTGFVIQQTVEDLGAAGPGILKNWIDAGLDLGNHSYAHPNFNELTVAAFEQQVIDGEKSFLPLMRQAGRQQLSFRFPFNHTGNTEEKKQALAAFLRARGYRLAPCTIENSDWLFNAAYLKMMAAHDHAGAARLRRDYLRFTAGQIDYFAHLNRQVLGYDPPQIMLLHDNRLNADLIEPLLKLFEQRGDRWVSLTQAEADPIYQTDATPATQYGPMWAYRWARQRGVKVDGSLETDPPTWIVDYGKTAPAPPRRPRSAF